MKSGPETYFSPQIRNGREVRSIKELADLLEISRLENKKIVHCHGVFDLLHIGHIRHFEEAKKLGDVLVVTVTPDRYVNKGPHRPAFTEQLRAEAILALHCVDYVAINEWPSAVEAIRLLKPNMYVKGPDYRSPERDITGKIAEEEVAVRSVGGRIAITDDIIFSSSNLINKFLPVFPKEVSDFLADFSSRYPTGKVLEYLDRLRNLKVLVMGEAIIDDYQYCEQIGIAAKEPVIAVLRRSSEQFAGGILAIANHIANFSNHVGLLTFLGDESPHEDFVRQHVNSKIDSHFFYKADSPTIVKRRFVESYLLQKLFEVYEMNGEDLNEGQDAALSAKLEEILPLYDVVVVADYGHGILTKRVIDTLSQKSRFLAVNTQANAGNRGFSTISKYPRADYVCLARHEIALEERKRHGDLKEMVLSVSEKLKCGKVIITCGKEGNMAYHAEVGFFQQPALASRVIDRIGAGDAVLSLTSMCVAAQVPMEVVAFVGNAAGAQAVATVGHRSSIERASFYKFIESLLK